jgi:hypothetical protein
MSTAEDISVRAGSIQEGAASVFVPQQVTSFGRPPAIRIAFPEFLPGHMQPVGKARHIHEVQLDLVLGAAGAAAKAGDGLLAFEFGSHTAIFDQMSRFLP